MIISIVNQIHSVLADTTTLSIGRALAVHGDRVLLIDLNPDARATSLLGISKTCPGLMDLIKGKSRVKDVIITVDGVDIIPSDTTSEFMRSSFDMGDDTFFKAITDSLEGLYDHIIIDCPADLSFIALNAIYSSDAVILLPSNKIQTLDYKFSVDIVGMCTQFIGTEPIKLSNDVDVMGQIEDCLLNNHKVLLLEPYANTTDTAFGFKSRQYVNEFILHLN